MVFYVKPVQLCYFWPVAGVSYFPKSSNIVKNIKTWQSKVNLSTDLCYVKGMATELYITVEMAQYKWRAPSHL